MQSPDLTDLTAGRQIPRCSRCATGGGHGRWCWQWVAPGVPCACCGPVVTATGWLVVR